MFRRHYVISRATILPTLEANYVQASHVAHDLFEGMSKHTIKDNVNKIAEAKLELHFYQKLCESMQGLCHSFIKQEHENLGICESESESIQQFLKKFQSLKKELLNLEYRLDVYELCANLDSNVLQEKSLASTVKELAEMPDLKTYLEKTKH